MLTLAGCDTTQKVEDMFGLIGKLTTVEGKRNALIALLLEGTKNMPGCLQYVVSKDVLDANVIWISEVWDSEDSHGASLSLPAVQDAIGKGRAFIAGMEQVAKTAPIGGTGLK